MKLRKWKGLFFVGLAAFTVGLLGAGCTTEPDSSGGGGGAPRSYTITYVDAATGAVLDTQKATDESGVYFDTSKLRKIGYKLTKFTDEADKTVVSGEYKLSKDVKIKVVYTPNSYKITFSKETYPEATGTLPEPMTCTYDAEVTLPKNALSYTTKWGEYVAEGWKDSKDDGGKVYADGTKVKNLSAEDGATLTLYANFRAKIALTFEVADGTDKNVYKNPGERLAKSEIPNAEKKGYLFKGWYVKDDAAKTLIDFTQYTVEKDASFKPLYEAKKITVSFVNELGDKTAPKAVTLAYDGKSIYLTDKAYQPPAVAGYTFEGWFKNKTGSGEPVKYVYPSSIEPFADITLYAKWKLWTAKISYRDEGTTQNVEYGKPVKLLKHTKKKVHSYFLGWTTESNATVEMYKEGADFTWKGAADGETVTLYSVWKTLPVKVFVKSAPPAAKGITDIKLEYVASSHLFRATLDGIDAFTWYVDGKKVDGQNLSTLSVSALSIGLHTVMVTAEKDGRLLSQTMVVSIKNAQ